MNKGAHILIVDDEPQMRKLLRITLESSGYSVSEAAAAREALTASAMHPPEAILLDLGLPDESGHAVLRQLREWYTGPVLIVSVQQDEADIVQALDNGANDYIVKPFRTGELLARLRSAFRGIIRDSDPVINCNALQIDLAARVVKKEGLPVKLTVTEYALFSLMLRHEGKVLTHQYLLREVWGPGYVTQSQYLRVFIAQLRKKLETDPNRPQMILTESGIGYRFVCRE